MKLTPEQSLAVHAPNHLAVIAVPGAGKTFMLVSRAVHLLNQLIATIQAVPLTDTASEHYGQIRTELQRQG